MLESTFLETRDAVGCLRWILVYGWVRPTIQTMSDTSSEQICRVLTCDCDGNNDKEIYVEELRGTFNQNLFVGNMKGNLPGSRPKMMQMNTVV